MYALRLASCSALNATARGDQSQPCEPLAALRHALCHGGTWHHRYQPQSPLHVAISPTNPAKQALRRWWSVPAAFLPASNTRQRTGIAYVGTNSDHLTLARDVGPDLLVRGLG